MPVTRLSANINAYQANDRQTSAGQLRNGFRRLLQSIKDGNLAEAQRAYDAISRTLPDFYQTLRGQLIQDYKAIGHALEKGDIARAQQAVVKLSQDLQSIGSNENLPGRERNLAGAGDSMSRARNMFNFYAEHNDAPALGTNIDIMV